MSVRIRKSIVENMEQHRAMQEAEVSLMGKLFPLTASELNTWGHPRRGSMAAAQKEQFSL